MAAPCINRCGIFFRSISRTAFRRCNITAANLMCTNSGDRNPPQGTPIGGSQSPGSGNGGSTSSAQSSNGSSQSYTQSSEQQAKFSEGLDNSENINEFSEVEDEEIPEESEEEFQTKQAILKASLPFVHQYGWTKKAIVAGAESIGMPSMVHGMFPRGGVELVFYFYEECNQELSTILKEKVQELKEKDEKIKTGSFIQNAIESRLKMIIPYIDKWPQAMAIQTLPQNAVQSWTNLSRVVDDIWFYAGDRSNDFNWYTKRVSLAAVYKSTEIYMLQDSSEDYLDTWCFLENRLEDVVKAGHLARNIQESQSVLSEGAKGFCLMTRNILGMNNR
uniref:Ubiquinone biosynthesis protein n=1 Tax=Crassostrea virginica TaxID=6565 RepID=A0A8B8APJ7_CRAVI|nr:ubiquinone biosynthesis protein COQ9, mitochondrial-like isoform X2 [Crassostrea virginica]